MSGWHPETASSFTASEANIWARSNRPSDRVIAAFGEGFRGLYVTAQKSVYYIPTKVNGTRTF